MKYSFPLCVLVLVGASFAQQIRGDYLETRNAEIYTGHCTANSEVNLVGDEALLAWHIRTGTWNRVPLDGLTVVAAVKAQGTLGDPYENPYPATAVLIVDDQATQPQQKALTAFAKQMGGPLLRNVKEVIAAPVVLVINREHHGSAFLRAGEIAAVRTRSLNENDHLCGNESTFYPPLTQVAHSMPAVAMTDAYSGPGLGVDWESHGRPSAFVGTFVR
jgi:hypothetical protein